MIKPERKARSLLTQKPAFDLLLGEGRQCTQGGANRAIGVAGLGGGEGVYRSGTENVPFLNLSGGYMAFISSLFFNLHMYVLYILLCKGYNSQFKKH